MAKQQGVISLAYDGAVALKVALPEQIRQTWNRRTMAGVVRNERLLAAQDEVLGWLDAAGIPAAILKGSSVARHYPQPELRVLGDVDILVPRAQVEQVQQILQCNGYRMHESDHNFHIGFDRDGAYVEIHYDVISPPDCKGGNAVQKETAHFLDHTDRGQVHTHTFPVLSQHHQALMLLLHMVRHMTEGGIGLRQLPMAGKNLQRGQGILGHIKERFGDALFIGKIGGVKIARFHIIGIGIIIIFIQHPGAVGFGAMNDQAIGGNIIFADGV
jgi:hypothetical protein